MPSDDDIVEEEDSSEEEQAPTPVKKAEKQDDANDMGVAPVDDSSDTKAPTGVVGPTVATPKSLQHFSL